MILASSSLGRGLLIAGPDVAYSLTAVAFVLEQQVREVGKGWLQR